MATTYFELFECIRRSKLHFYVPIIPAIIATYIFFYNSPYYMLVAKSLAIFKTSKN